MANRARPPRRPRRQANKSRRRPQPHGGGNVPKSSREREFTKAVLDIATIHKWLCTHNSDSRKTLGDAGVPDLMLAKDGRLIFAELKVPPNRLTESQKVWMARLSEAGAPVEVYLWTPSDMDTIIAVLGANNTGEQWTAE